jgi:hypothetical protein
MSWNKGAQYDANDEMAQDFRAAVKQLTDVLTRYPQSAGMAAVAYLVACIYVTVSNKVIFDELVKVYAGKIKRDVLGEGISEAIERGDTDSVIAHLQAQLRKSGK